jgi:hypothetical protein
MIRGAHILLYSTNPEADRAFFRDVLGFASVDVGGGWLIFQLPPSEMAVHPADGPFQQQHGDEAISGCVLYLICDDLGATVKSLSEKNIPCSKLHTERWGTATTVTLPSGGKIGLYQPTHKLAIDL